MPIDPDTYYGSIAGADTYFGERLHQSDWAVAPVEDKDKALLAATRDVDALSFAGEKTTVHDLLESNPNATDEEIAAAEEAQALQFPRDGDDTVPDEVLFAVYEIANQRLRGRDPDQEQENLRMTSSGSGSTRLSTSIAGAATVHLANGIVSFTAWRFLLPLLDSNSSFDLKRV